LICTLFGEKNHRQIPSLCILIIHFFYIFNKIWLIIALFVQNHVGEKFHRIGDIIHHKNEPSLRIVLCIGLAFFYKCRVINAEHYGSLAHGAFMLYGAQDYGLLISCDEIL